MVLVGYTMMTEQAGSRELVEHGRRARRVRLLRHFGSLLSVAGLSKRVPHGGALADKELADHAEVEQRLKDLEDLHAEEPQFNEVVGRLKFDVASPARGGGA